MKVLIIGAGGQLGRSLQRTVPPEIAIHAPSEWELDLTKREHVAAAIAKYHPNVISNAAAYTAVDRAETERSVAFAVNAEAVEGLAQLCAYAHIKLMHVSTDYVFDGEANSAYSVDAVTRPMNVYGASKLAGEERLRATANLDFALVRTAWVYAPWGHNFVLTMLKLFRERGGTSVVADQIGAPTSALNLARFLWCAALREARGVFHYTDAGVASWYDFAMAINEEALSMGLLASPAIVKSITTADYPTPAKRPRFSLLETRTSVAAVGAHQPHWREALREVLKELKDPKS